MGVEVRVPLHITGFWRPVYRSSPLYTGSIGAGVNIGPKLVARAFRSLEKRLYLNGRPMDGVEPVDHVFSRLPCPFTVYARTAGVLGAGFGLSGALSLAVSIAGSIICGERMTLEDAAARAHVAEVVSRTGLGDVIAEYYGGLEVRTAPGAPGIGVVVRIPVDPGVRVVAIVLSRMHTGEMLSRYTPELGSLASRLLDRLLDNPCLEEFIRVSSLFTRRLFDYGGFEGLVSGVRSRVIGYYVKKGVGVLFVDRDAASDIASYFRGKGLHVVCGRIDYAGVEVEDTPEPPEEGEPAR